MSAVKGAGYPRRERRNGKLARMAREPAGPAHRSPMRRHLLEGAGALVLGAAVSPSVAGTAPKGPAAPAAARTGWFDDARFSIPAFEASHPEQPGRVRAIQDRVRADAALWARLQRLQPLLGAVVDAALARAHTGEHIRGIAVRHGAAIDTLARTAVGCALAAVQAVGRAGLSNAFVASRPPGHHARNSGREEGFCFYNNVAIAARHVQRVLGFERVLIVDWDYHHGNGTEHLFYEDGSVFYFSTFDADAYPRSGTAARIGAGAGRGTTLNHPLPAGASDDDVLTVYERSLVPAATRFDPDFVLVSAGFDSREGDTLGRFSFSDEGYRRMTRVVASIAARHCGGRLVSLLEGGYNLGGLASAAHAHVWALSEAALAMPEPRR